MIPEITKKIVDIISTEKNPFLDELEARYQLENVQRNTYTEMYPLLDLLFQFCEYNHITKDNKYTGKNNTMWMQDDYLYLCEEGSFFQFFRDYWMVNLRIRRDGGKYIFEIYKK